MSLGVEELEWAYDETVKLCHRDQAVGRLAVRDSTNWDKREVGLL